MSDVVSSSSGIDMARRPRAPLRNGAGGQGQPSGPFAVGVAMPGADEYPFHGDDLVDELEIEDDDDLLEDAAAVFGIDVGDDSVPNDVVDVDGDGGGGADSTNTHGTSSASKRTFTVWVDFEEIKENDIRIVAICKMCDKRYSARSVAGTGHLLRHQASCKKKHDHAHRVQSRLALNPHGLHNWKYDPAIARTELCRLIARVDLPLGIGETQAYEDYIKRAHNPQFEKVSRQTITRDLGKLFVERRGVLMNSVLPVASSVFLTSNIWSGNAKEDYISVVSHYVSADWELQKKVVGFRLIEVSHSGENIVERIASMVEEFGLIDNVFLLSL
jgi:hypothetical protein